ncbi:MAG: biotin/lipoyl-binding protein, partial [Paracoccus sp. (in: a-proteobacteria)]|nr:biotin/lipoyl-binding protein [Paracoccus sp. (in: a-proteobacteria)]
MTRRPTLPARALLAAALACLTLLGPALAEDGWPEHDAQQEGAWIAVARGTVDVAGGLMRLAAQREGLIVEVLASEGDHVSEGQILARIDDKSAALQLEMARAEADQAATQVE